MAASSCTLHPLFSPSQPCHLPCMRAGGIEHASLVPSMPPNLLHYRVTSSVGRKTDTLRRVIHALDLQVGGWV